MLYRLGKDLEGVPGGSVGQNPGQMMLQTIRQYHTEVNHFTLTIGVPSQYNVLVADE